MEYRRSKRSLSVIFVDDNEVNKVHHGSNEKKVELIPLAQRGRQNRKTHPRNSTNDGVELQPLEELEEDGCDDVILKPTELLEGEENIVKGASVFGFNTPKKKFGMLEKASSARKTTGSPVTPKTPRLSGEQWPSVCRTPRTPKTPKTPRTPISASKSVYKTPVSRKRLSDVMSEPKTPYNFRKRVKQRIKKIVYEDDSCSSSDEDYEADSSSNSSDSDDDSKENLDFNENPLRTPRRTPNKASMNLRRSVLSGTPGRTPTRTPGKGGRGRKIRDVEMVAKSDDYFLSCGDGKFATSDHTLSRLKTPRLSPEALQTILSGVTTSHQNEREALLEEHVRLFPRWMIYLVNGFSIFLYGLGSKKQLISFFQQEYLEDYDHIVVNGFFPSLMLKNILNNITEDILEYSGSFHSVQDQLKFIQNAYAKADAAPLFVLIHNLDGPMLRGEKTQAAIAQLASADHIHLLVSIDHINAPLLFDGSKMSHYNVLWFDATTMAPYTEETSYENSLLVQQSGSLALSSLIHVFKSLTPNAKGIFLLLARHQLNQKDNSSYTGLSFSDMYQRCREAFLVNSDLTLRAQLTEFRDHKLIRSKKGVDGVENLIIPLDASTLQEFINQQELE